MAVNEASVTTDKRKLFWGIHEKPPLSMAVPLAFQHILAMFVANVSPTIVVTTALGFSITEQAFLIQCCLVVSGIVTLMQTNKIGPVGANLPVVMGTSFTFVPTSIGIGQLFGYPGVLGAAFVGGLFEGVLGAFLKPLRKYFPPVVTGTVLLTIGLSLIPTGATYLAGGNGASDFGSISNLVLGGIVLVTILFFNQFTKGMSSISSILIGIIVGYIASIFMGKADFSAVSSAAWVSLPIPLVYKPTFHWPAIAAMLVVYVVTTVESVGAINGITVGGEGREATDDEVSGGIIGDGLGSSVAALFNTLPNTTFNQNISIIAFTKVMSRHVINIGALILICAGLCPKLGTLIAAMHPSILGGAGVVMFSMICSVGIQVISRSKLTNRDMLIVAVSLGLGLGLPSVPAALANFSENARLILNSSVVVAAMAALVLNVVFPKETTEK